MEKNGDFGEEVKKTKPERRIKGRNCDWDVSVNAYMSDVTRLLPVIFLLSGWCNSTGQTGGGGGWMEGWMDAWREGGREGWRRGSGMTHIAKLGVFIVKKCPNW